MNDIRVKGLSKVSLDMLKSSFSLEATKINDCLIAQILQELEGTCEGIISSLHQTSEDVNGGISWKRVHIMETLANVPSGIIEKSNIHALDHVETMLGKTFDPSLENQTTGLFMLKMTL